MRIAILSAAFLLAACAGSDSPSGPTVWVADGEPVNCINRSQVRGFRAIDEQTVDFERNRNQAWRNNLPFRCQGLTFGQSIRVNSRTQQVCSFDSITPKSFGSGPSAPRCQLGQFQPMKRVPAPATPPPAATQG